MSKRDMQQPSTQPPTRTTAAPLSPDGGASFVRPAAAPPSLQPRAHRPPRRSAGRLLALLGVFLLLGSVVTTLVTWSLALALNPLDGAQFRGQGYVGEESWQVDRWHRRGADLVWVTWKRGHPWSPTQATGAPDTPTAADQVTAWASASSDGADEWLELTYERAVIPRELHVHCTYNPGALYRATVFDAAGREMEAWRGTDPVAPGSGMGMSRLPLAAANVPTNRVRIYLASTKVPGWNEVDAVALVDDAGGKQYAIGASASSWYTSGAARSGPPGPMPPGTIPAWAGLSAPPESFRANRANAAEVAVEAYGWPFLAMRTTRHDPGAAMQAVNTAAGAGAAAVPAVTGLLLTGGGIAAPQPLTPVGPAAQGAAMRLKPRLPLTPLLTGFALNSLLAATFLGAGFWVLTRPRRFLVEVSRIRLGHCLRCGYDLGYDFRAGCPECGWRRTGHEA